MSNSTYCPHCAAKIQYTIQKPEKCPKCSKDIGAKAFKQVLQPSAAPKVNLNLSPNSYPQMRAHVHDTQVIDADGFSSDDYSDSEVNYLKEQILASLGGQLSIKTISDRDKITFGELAAEAMRDRPVNNG